PRLFRRPLFAAAGFPLLSVKGKTLLDRDRLPRYSLRPLWDAGRERSGSAPWLGRNSCADIVDPFGRFWWRSSGSGSLPRAGLGSRRGPFWSSSTASRRAPAG